ncbi:hypothetical protein [Natrarchaeobaculum sulfurireducens]|uniref:hypothetical protein n=1 Tax=Natrarchaeobaculum sulfurireducens TaxID=2044521 RepID=UPI000E3E82C2|nr:hypothetical protein [Natrarchaeobaculum sulfurireducens]
MTGSHEYSANDHGRRPTRGIDRPPHDEAADSWPLESGLGDLMNHGFVGRFPTQGNAANPLL